MKKTIKLFFILLIMFLLLLLSKNESMASSNTYVGNINSQIINMSLIQRNYEWDKFLSGEIVVVEWVNGKSTVPTKTPTIKLKSTDGTLSVDAFVTPTGTNTYYFDRNLTGIDVTKEYYLEISSSDKTNISPNKTMNAYFSNTKYNNKTIGVFLNGYVNDKEHYGKSFNVNVSGQKISFKDYSYVGNINSEIINMSLIQRNYEWDKFLSGEIVVVEWVNGKSTVPTKTPTIKLKSTDGTVSVDAFVTPTGTNTYYFDRALTGIDVTKEYYLEVSSSDKTNISPNKTMNAYFSNTKYNNKTIGVFLNGYVNDKEHYGKYFNVNISGQKVSFKEIK